MYYDESALWDIIGIKPFSIKTYYGFKCKAMPWANNRIRIAYLAGGYIDRFIGKTWNTS